MKNVVWVIVLTLTGFTARSQTIRSEAEARIKNSTNGMEFQDEILAANDALFDKLEDPDFYDDLWSKLVKAVTNRDSIKGYWLNSLNLDFKSFQTGEIPASSLGFTYDLNVERGRQQEGKASRNFLSLAFSAKGNVTFNKELNPADFLDTKMSGKYSIAFGGLRLNEDPNMVHQRILTLLPVLMETPQAELKKTKEWKEFKSLFTLKNSYLFNTNFHGGLESNQDFTEKQYAFGAAVGFSAKAWESTNLLARLNILDYPFALLRWISKTDETFSINGSTVPSVLVGLDYVNPVEDSLRSTIDPDLDPYFRFKFEAGFKTLVVSAFKQTIYFEAAYKVFQEISPTPESIEAGLTKNQYVVAALHSDKGFFVSYAYGSLPFDRKDDAIYQLGFNYKFK